MDSDFDWSDLDSRYLALTFDSASSLVLTTIYKSHHLLTCDKIHQLLPCHKAHLIPAEMFSEIFLYMVQANPSS